MKKLNLILFGCLFILNNTTCGSKFSLIENKDSYVFADNFMEIDNNQNQQIIIDLSNLPANIWTELASFGINKNAPTEKEIFQNFELIKSLNKKIRNAALEYIKTVGLKLGYKNYTYIQFKIDLMNILVHEKSKNIPTIEATINEAINMQAKTWIKYQISKNKNFFEILKKELFEAINAENYNKIKKLAMLMSFRVYDHHGNNPLHYAAKCHNYQIFGLILSIRPQLINETNRYGVSPLDDCLWRNIKILRMILDIKSQYSSTHHQWEL